MRRQPVGLAFVALVAAGLMTVSGAALAKAARHAPLPLGAPTWTVDKAASRLSFKGMVSGQGFDGVFKKWDARITFDPKDLKASHAAVTIDIASVVTGDPTRDQMLPTGDWFATQKFPKASFTTAAITEVSPGHYQAVGDLRIRSMVRRVAMPFTLTIAQDVAKMDGALTVDRRWFGVGQGQFASPDTVAGNVTVLVRLSAKKAH